MTVIRSASSKLGRDLSGCVMIATHEPCPMCATAIIWSGITEIAFGYSIKEAIKQGRKRIDLSCRELFKRAGKEICVNEALLHDQCSVLYIKAVRDSNDMRKGSEVDTPFRQIHPKLRFTRNYKYIRPHTDYCEEVIILES